MISHSMSCKNSIMLNQLDLLVQQIIRKYTAQSGNGNKHAALASCLGSLTWEKPSYAEFQQLARYMMSYTHNIQ